MYFVEKYIHYGCQVLYYLIIFAVDWQVINAYEIRITFNYLLHRWCKFFVHLEKLWFVLVILFGIFSRVINPQAIFFF